ncbi:uncharacterized protein A1O9_10579 [Exophiala aquamarina CBS 119918]|uniref:Uncharacterized protein n=1 Tax=Exophiala aquamarina CBS 119918 TaxID=1182545 RepID=A0A072P0E0_9EURO|nr:uncharacterized protein A1O9_10579 [Exophiala aquamarina CBS 119918]KEF53604.1 hypothetical protein A1O9_10579 [Exophiala aquamarina CBS 119918]
MHLINVNTLKLEEFADGINAPSYAILSHRWEDEEVSYKDLRRGRASQCKGYRKIQMCCKQAHEARLQYAWVDTCCIDKRSSSELSEAINSMFRWYQNATVCYAYLSDVNAPAAADPSVRMPPSAIGKSLWFTRGWTLQELIAPRELEFYDANWTCLGTRGYLQDAIAQATRIPVPILTGKDKPNKYPVAQRMSWAARRKTTRVEDVAYCLLGIFGVNMPLLYGEGERAFTRLQEEIIKRSDDETIFAWPGICSPGHCTPGRCSGVTDLEIATALEDATGCLLAKSPLLFAGCGGVVRTIQGSTPYDSHDYTFTNVGLSIRMPLVPWTLDTYLGFLNCYLYSTNKSKPEHVVCAIRLRKCKRGLRNTQFVRVDTVSGCISSADFGTFKAARWKDIIIRDFQDRSTPILGQLNSNFLYGFHLTVSAVLDLAPIVHRYPISENKNSTVEIPMGKSGTIAVIELQDSQSSELRTLVKLGFDFNFSAVIQVQIKHEPISDAGLIDVMKSDWIEQFDSRRQLSIRSRTHSSDLSDCSFTQTKEHEDEALHSHEPGIWTFLVADASVEITNRILELNARIVVSQVASEWTLALQAMDPRIPAFRRPPADDLPSPGA